MKPVTALIIALGILSLNSDSANATCSVTFEHPSPILVSQFGSKAFMVGPQQVITRAGVSGTLDLYCANGFNE